MIKLALSTERALLKVGTELPVRLIDMQRRSLRPSWDVTRIYYKQLIETGSISSHGILSEHKVVVDELKWEEPSLNHLSPLGLVVHQISKLVVGHDHTVFVSG
jgi:hypothetical protein